jgi:exonuclease SbcD
MTNYGKMDIRTGLHERVLDFLDTMDCLVDAVAELCPDIIVFAGDAFKTRIPNPTLVSQFCDRIVALANVAPVFAVVGNHDKHRGGLGKRDAISVLKDLRSEHRIVVADSVQVHDDICDAVLVSLPWMYGDEEIIDNVVDISLPDDRPCILVAHAEVEGAHYDSGMETFGESCTLVGEDLLSMRGVYDYIALGHLHRHQKVFDNPLAVYSGSLDRINMGERRGRKGFVVADVQAGQASYEFFDLHVRRMVDLRIEWGKLDNVADVDVTDAIVKVTVCDVPSEIPAYTVTGAVHELVEGYHYFAGVVVEHRHTVQARDKDSKDVGSLAPLDALGVYLDNRYADDPERADALYFAAEDLIGGV